MTRYLVTGGCGFIGSHLTETLLAAGHQVLILDDLSSGKKEQTAPGADLCTGCITDLDKVARCLKEVDGCFHLAAIASTMRSIDEWAESHRINSYGTLVLLEAISHLKRPIPFFFASSAAIYGTEASLSPYGADKSACETQLALAWHLHGIPSLSFRFFNVYGPRQDPSSPYSGVISVFSDKLQKGLPLPIYGSGEQTRDFIFVGDVAALLLETTKHPFEGAHAFDLCRGEGTSINSLAHILKEICGATVPTQHLPPRAADILHSCGDPKKFEALFHKKAETSLRDGLLQTIEYQRVKT